MTKMMVLAMLALCSVIALLVVWRVGEITDFTSRCLAAGGRVEQFSSRLDGYKCLTPDGRIIDIEGPGL